MPRTAAEKLNAKKDSKKVVLESDFAGMKRGQMLFVGTPQIVAEYIRRIPPGRTKTVEQMRREMARRRRCDGTCPVSTAIFVRIAGEAACEEMDAGRSPDDVIPFWRILTSTDKIAKKLPIDGAWIDERRALEQGDSA